MSIEAPRESRRRSRLLSPYEQYQLQRRSESIMLGEMPQSADDILAAATEMGALIDQQGFDKKIQPGAALCQSYLPFFVRAGMLRKKPAYETLSFLSRQLMNQAQHTFQLDGRTLLVGLMAESSFASVFCSPHYPTDIRLWRTSILDDMREKTDFLVERTIKPDVTCLGRVDVKAKGGGRFVSAKENHLGVLEVHVPLYLNKAIQPSDGTPVFSFPPHHDLAIEIQTKVGRYLSAIGDNYRLRDIPLEW